MKISGWVCALALSGVMASMSFGQITGKVTVKGKVPEMPEILALKNVPGCAHKDPVFDEKIVSDDKGNLGNVVVYIKFPEGKAIGKASATPAVLDQKGCMYVPHVIAVMIGQGLEVKNSDRFLHNVHTLPFDNGAVNIGMPNVGVKKLDAFKAVETFKVKCDVHPWMAAWVAVLDNPYFAVSSAEDKNMGQFSIDTAGLPDGDYMIVAWQEAFGELAPTKITVASGKATVNLTFDAAKKAALAPAAKEIHLASACCEQKLAK